MTVSVPSGAVEVLHEAAPSTRAPVVQSVVVPTVNVTLPVGVPIAEVTEAEYVTALPKVLDEGLTETRRGRRLHDRRWHRPAIGDGERIAGNAPRRCDDVPAVLIISTGVWVTGLEPELVSAILENEAEPKSANVDWRIVDQWGLPRSTRRNCPAPL